MFNYRKLRSLPLFVMDNYSIIYRVLKNYFDSECKINLFLQNKMKYILLTVAIFCAVATLTAG